MSVQKQIEEIELSIENAKNFVAMRDAIKNLYNNEDFKRVVLDGYFKEEAARVVALKADPNAMGENEQKMIDSIITSIGGFRQYLMARVRLGEQSEMALAEDRETHAELLREEAQGEA